MDMTNHHWLFTQNSDRDFSRHHVGKLSFYDTMRSIVGMGKGSTSDEIMDYLDLNPSRNPSRSAFNRRKSQIALSAFEYLLTEFSCSFHTTTKERMEDKQKNVESQKYEQVMHPVSKEKRILQYKFNKGYLWM